MRKQMIKKKREALYKALLEIARVSKNSHIFFKKQSLIEQLKLELFAMEYR